MNTNRVYNQSYPCFDLIGCISRSSFVNSYTCNASSTQCAIIWDSRYYCAANIAGRGHSVPHIGHIIASERSTAYTIEYVRLINWGVSRCIRKVKEIHQCSSCQRLKTTTFKQPTVVNAPSSLCRFRKDLSAKIKHCYQRSTRKSSHYDRVLILIPLPRVWPSACFRGILAF